MVRPPTILTLKSEAEENKAVADWLAEQRQRRRAAPRDSVSSFAPKLNSTAPSLPRKKPGCHSRILDEHVETASGHISICTMHLAKGLEFRAVAVMACDDEIIPLQQRIQTVGDDADLQEVYDTERQLLYVACTRARDHLLVTSVEPASEFLDDLRT